MRTFPAEVRPPSSNRLWIRLGLFVLLLAAFALRLHELARQDIWWDEARNIDVALRPLVQVATAPELDIHPPLYFWLLHVWLRLAGVARGQEPAQIAFMARFLSVWAGVVGVGLLYALAAGATNRRAALPAAGIGALSPFWLAESQEARMYTLGFALLMAGGLALYRCIGVADTGEAGILRDLHRRRGLLALCAVLSAAALWTHYNAVFIVAAWYLWWGVVALLRRGQARRNEFAAAAVTGLATVVLVLPLAPIALRQIPGYANPNLGIPSVAEYLTQNWRAYVGGYAFSAELLGGYGRLWLWGVALATLAGATAYVATRRRVAFGREGLRLLLLVFWIAGGLVLYYLAVLDRGAFNVRYSSFVTPALYALIGVVLGGWSRRWPVPVLGAALLLAGFAPAIRADLYDARFDREDIAGVTNWLREHAGPGDVIFVDQKYPFGFYYERYAIDPAQRPEGEEAAPARYLFVDINTVADRLNEWAGEAEHVFWVQWFESDTDPRPRRRFPAGQGRHARGRGSVSGLFDRRMAVGPADDLRVGSQHDADAACLCPGGGDDGGLAAVRRDCGGRRGAGGDPLAAYARRRGSQAAESACGPVRCRWRAAGAERSAAPQRPPSPARRMDGGRPAAQRVSAACAGGDDAWDSRDPAVGV